LGVRICKFTTTIANLKLLQLDAQKKKQRSAAPQNVLIIPSLLNVWLAFVSHFPSLKHLETMGKQWVLYRAGRVMENRSQR
jgi:hypothetical protein